jgi:hypothetical protein
MAVISHKPLMLNRLWPAAPSQLHWRRSCVAPGSDDFDRKPVVFDRLVGKIETLLTRHAGL